jgi:ketosteroid isomerase-like protein
MPLSPRLVGQNVIGAVVRWHQRPISARPPSPEDMHSPGWAVAPSRGPPRLRDTPRMPEESTTPDLVERWQKAAEAHARRDFDAMMRFFAPDAVWDASSAGVGNFEGAAAIRSFLEEWIGAYEEYEYNQEEGQDLGNGVLFAVASLGGRPASSGGRVQERRSYTVTWTEGMIARVVGRADIDEARVAAERLAEERG